MNKLALSILSLLIGFVAGILISYIMFVPSPPKRSFPENQYFYYRLSDSTAARHTIGLSDSGLIHKVDTIVLEKR
jgi:hypothetical protein